MWQVPDEDEGEMGDEGEDEESGGELDDETDEYESTSPGALAAILAGGHEVNKINILRYVNTMLTLMQ